MVKLDPKSHAFIVLLGALSAIPPLSIDSSLPALPMIGASLRAPATAVQWTLSGFLIGFAGGQILWGQAADRYGRRPVLLFGLGLYIVAGIGCAIAPTIWTLVVMRLVQGLGACAGAVMGRAMIRDCFEGPGAVAKQALLGLIAPLAMLSAPILGGLILSVADWRANYAVLPITGGVLTIITMLVLPETRRPERQRARAPFIPSMLAFLLEPRAIGFAILNALVFGGMFAYISGSSLVLIDHFHVSPELFGFLFAVAALALIAGALFTNLSLRYLRARTSRRIGLALMAVALVLVIAFSHSESLSLVLMGAAAVTFASGMLMPHAIASAMAPLPQIAGTASGLLGALQSFAGALSATMIGLNGAGTVAGMFTTIGLFLIGALLVGVLLETRSGEASR